MLGKDNEQMLILLVFRKMMIETGKETGKTDWKRDCDQQFLRRIHYLLKKQIYMQQLL